MLGQKITIGPSIAPWQNRCLEVGLPVLELKSELYKPPRFKHLSPGTVCLWTLCSPSTGGMATQISAQMHSP